MPASEKNPLWEGEVVGRKRRPYVPFDYNTKMLKIRELCKFIL